MSVVVRGLTRRFPSGALALDRADLDIGSGELMALLGPSGSGKSTLLRVLAGLDHAEAGEVLIGGRAMARVPARARQVGMVFQHYALFQHMTVFENVAFGLRVRARSTRPSRSDIAARVERLLGLVQLGGLERRLPSQLSGGQRQRVALARALAIEPAVLLLDEPFGALDAHLRRDLRRWLRELHLRLGLTTLLVTHDQEEALEMADRVAVMHAGRVVQVGAAEDFLHLPTGELVATP